MARPTRQQRRARRAERSKSSLAEQTRAAQKASSLRAQKPGAAPTSERRRFGFGFIRFIGESTAELKKVEWPGRQQLVQGTVVVIIACAIVGGYLAVCDAAFQRIVHRVLLGQ